METTAKYKIASERPNWILAADYCWKAQLWVASMLDQDCNIISDEVREKLAAASNRMTEAAKAAQVGDIDRMADILSGASLEKPEDYAPFQERPI